MKYGVHVCSVCLQDAACDQDGDPEPSCDCKWKHLRGDGPDPGLPVYIEVTVPRIVARVLVRGGLERDRAARAAYEARR